MDDEFGLDGEFGLDDDGRLDLFGSAGSPEYADVPADGEPGEQPYPWEDCGDDDEAWLRSMPADIRAEIDARQPLPPARPGASQWEVLGGTAAFGYGGFCDTMLPGSALGEMLATAGSDGWAALSDDVLAGMMRAWHRQVSHSQAALGHLVAEICRRRIAQSRRPGWSGAAEHVVDELGVELTLSSRSAERLRDVATGLQRLREVNSALLSGLIDWPRACAFVDELAVLDDGAALQIAESLADKAVGWTVGQLRAALVRAVLAADPAAAERRKQQARKQTRVELWHEPSGNAALAGRELRPGNAIALDRKLSSDADWLSACGVPGSLGELRALAYTTLLSGRELASILDDPACWPRNPSDAEESAGGSATFAGDGAREGATTATTAQNAGTAQDAGTAQADAAARDGAVADPRGSAGGPQPSTAGSIHLTMPLSALAGLSESPGEVAGYGPVDAVTSRELAGLLARDNATRWCLTVTSPDGIAVAHACARRGPATRELAEGAEPGEPGEPSEPVIGWAAGLLERLQMLESGECRHARQSTGYVPPPRLRHLVMVRQRRCSFPGCRRPAPRCDLDHTVPFEAGGLTCECNLAPLCRRHHRAKQVPGWQLAQHHPGHMTWRLPSGRQYTTTSSAYPA